MNSVSLNGATHKCCRCHITESNFTAITFQNATHLYVHKYSWCQCKYLIIVVWIWYLCWCVCFCMWVRLCLCSHRASEESSLGIDHAEEMELLLENYFMQAEELGNKARELKDLIDDSESVIFINLDRYCTGGRHNAFNCTKATGSWLKLLIFYLTERTGLYADHTPQVNSSPINKVFFCFP